MALNYEIADMCKKCMKAHIKKKGSFKVSCTPVPKELENGKLFFLSILPKRNIALHRQKQS